MQSDRTSPQWIHVLLKGERTRVPAGENHSLDGGYLREFLKRSLDAIHIPILEFNFKLDSFNERDWIQTLPQTSGKSVFGLILTSPRSVEWVSLALENNLIRLSANNYAIHSSHHLGEEENLSSSYKMDASHEVPVDAPTISGDLVFVVGPRTADCCAEKLHIECNSESIETGSASELAKIILNFCKSHCDIELNLLYPKSSLADSTIEKALGEVTNVNLKAFIAYETSCLIDLEALLFNDLVGHLSERKEHLSRSTRISSNSPRNDVDNMQVPLDSTTGSCIINFIFFSPSGVDGFCRAINLEDLSNKLAKALNGRSGTVAFKFSCIGKTTQQALMRNHLEIFCVASKPTAQSLVEDLISKCQSHSSD